MVYGPPVPAAAGLKVLPLIPVPLNVPPEGEPVNVTAEAFAQIEAGKPTKLTTGNPLTVTVCAVELVQPLLLV